MRACLAVPGVTFPIACWLKPSGLTLNNGGLHAQQVNEKLGRALTRPHEEKGTATAQQERPSQTSSSTGAQHVHTNVMAAGRLVEVLLTAIHYAVYEATCEGRCFLFVGSKAGLLGFDLHTHTRNLHETKQSSYHKVHMSAT